MKQLWFKTKLCSRAVAIRQCFVKVFGDVHFHGQLSFAGTLDKLSQVIIDPVKNLTVHMVVSAAAE